MNQGFLTCFPLAYIFIQEPHCCLCVHYMSLELNYKEYIHVQFVRKQETLREFSGYQKQIKFNLFVPKYVKQSNNGG